MSSNRKTLRDIRRAVASMANTLQAAHSLSQAGERSRLDRAPVHTDPEVRESLPEVRDSVSPTSWQDADTNSSSHEAEHCSRSHPPVPPIRSMIERSFPRTEKKKKATTPRYLALHAIAVKPRHPAAKSTMVQRLEEELANCTFHPVTNTKHTTVERTLFYDRLHREKKIETTPGKPQHSEKPVASQKQAEQASPSGIWGRLYAEAKKTKTVKSDGKPPMAQQVERLERKQRVQDEKLRSMRAARHIVSAKKAEADRPRIEPLKLDLVRNVQ